MCWAAMRAHCKKVVGSILTWGAFLLGVYMFSQTRLNVCMQALCLCVCCACLRSLAHRDGAPMKGRGQETGVWQRRIALVHERMRAERRERRGPKTWLEHWVLRKRGEIKAPLCRAGNQGDI